ncbi:hypothetical protein WT27_13075 [Burkholderia territorii]|uniref:Uncharacterized protein n=1 Tax=Burkholderia territorii TaxID=1503055 RepID=A0A105V4T9_9BURK|nr:hypothetical protein WT27_13075 [Burkholderia territorii]
MLSREPEAPESIECENSFDTREAFGLQCVNDGCGCEFQIALMGQLIAWVFFEGVEDLECAVMVGVTGALPLRCE